MSAAWQRVKSAALRPIARVVDNTEAMAIEQSNIDLSKSPRRKSIQPGGAGTFSPYSNQNFK